MYEDLVRRLRNASVFYKGLAGILPNGSDSAELFDEAADAIEKLEEKAQAYEEFVPWSLRGVSDK